MKMEEDCKLPPLIKAETSIVKMEEDCKLPQLLKTEIKEEVEDLFGSICNDFVCPECKMHFENAQLFIEHAQTYHSSSAVQELPSFLPTDNLITASDSSNSHVTEKRDQVVASDLTIFPTSSDTSKKPHSENNQRKTTGDKLPKLYKCSLCPFGTIKKQVYIGHKRKHAGEKPHQCPECSYSSYLKSGLKSHLRTHTGEKPFKCSYCPFRTAESRNLIKHERNHTLQQPYKCSYCSFSSSQRTGLTVHQRTHTGERPY